MRKISIIFGTRPEAIKLCPLILAMRSCREIDVHVCVTAQHREMLDQVLEVFSIIPDADLSIMTPNQSLSGMTGKAITAIDGYLSDQNPEMVIVQGDTTTTFCSALASFYHKIPIGHIEAGLRTWNKFAPFPEEVNRVMTSHIVDLHFAPTELSKRNLLMEGITEGKIIVTGNTVIDALLFAAEKAKSLAPGAFDLPEVIFSGLKNGHKLVLITGHRRENFGQGFESICKAISTLAKTFGDVEFVYPVHMNPNVEKPVHHMLSGLANVHLIRPVSYLAFVLLMTRSTLILTDSGGIQEEAPSLGKPVLVMRDTTERPEGIQTGTTKLVGTKEDVISKAVAELLTDQVAYNKMATLTSPYGDGRASERIVAACLQFLKR